jgi:hypothetical protein
LTKKNKQMRSAHLWLPSHAPQGQPALLTHGGNQPAASSAITACRSVSPSASVNKLCDAASMASQQWRQLLLWHIHILVACGGSSGRHSLSQLLRLQLQRRDWTIKQQRLTPALPLWQLRLAASSDCANPVCCPPLLAGRAAAAAAGAFIAQQAAAAGSHCQG